MTRPAHDDKKTIAAWCLFDWANSPFTTLVVTFLYSTYFTKAMAPDEITGTALWSRGITATALAILILSPILGALADQRGIRRRLLMITTGVCIAATAALTFVVPKAPNSIVVALSIFVIGNVGFELGMVFYNSFLPDIASPNRIGRVSGWGWGVGYIGGLVCLVIALVGFVQPETPWFGLTKEAGFNVRATNLLVAAWLLVFCIPLFATTRDTPRKATGSVFVAPFQELWRTVREARRFREAAKFLLARLMYNEGLVTIFAFGGIYAAGTFGMTFAEILVFGIALNFAAGIGAFLFGMVDDRIGGKRTVLWSIAALTVASAIAVWAPTRLWLWVGGVLVGIFAGPNQSASRSLMGRFAPPERRNEFFGLFAFSGRLSAFFGPLALGTATQVFASQRAGVATVLVFFIIGGVLMLSVDEPAGVAAAAVAGNPRGLS